MGSLEGKSALVTGAGRGIGEATARKLASHGARVLVNDLDADVAEAVAASIPGAVAFPADLTDPAAADQVVNGAIDALGFRHRREQRGLYMAQRHSQHE